MRVRAPSAREDAPTGREIERLLEATGWTRSQLAAVLSVSRWTVWRWVCAADAPAPISPLALSHLRALLARPEVQAALREGDAAAA